MGKKISRRLVVDASVGQAAGTTEHPVSTACRESLKQIMTVCHRIVMTEALWREWRRHSSNYSQTWLAAMVSKRKMVEVSPSPAPPGLTSALDDTAFSKKDRDNISKDLHLVLAAVATDRAVVSRDDNARALFQLLAEHANAIASVSWVNPCKDKEAAIEWLKAGARNEPGRRLRP